ncbi:MAG: 16S rRNA (cytosine(1402)-N(4))-methyltransferase, partial [Pseudomonadota bacterium]
MPEDPAVIPEDPAILKADQPFFHVPVLPTQVLDGLQIKAGGRYLDATVGGGGHSSLILQAAPDVTLVALDQDLQALAAAKERLAEYGDRFARYIVRLNEMRESVKIIRQA